MSLDVVKMQAIAAESHAVAAHRHFGVAGIDALRALVEAVTRLYKSVEPDGRSERLALFMRVEEAAARLREEPAFSARALHEIADPARTGHELDASVVVEVTERGSLRVFAEEDLDLQELSGAAIVYLYDGGVERFLINGEAFRIINPAPTHASIFSRPTFSSLSEALEDYRVRVVRDTSCFILAGIWDDAKRLFLRTKPEATMRRSLHQYLRTVFRDAEVRPEQVVDESHPVDIKITWPDTNRRAIIEIKWLGQSRDGGGKLTTSYGAARAREGAQQLADYLDADRTAGPGLRTRGYLVVFDARRRRLAAARLVIDAADGLFYRDAEIDYDPDHHVLRRDFARPVRMFAEPVLN